MLSANDDRSHPHPFPGMTVQSALTNSMLSLNGFLMPCPISVSGLGKYLVVV
ncbi:MAG: hypothetical protein WC325_13215 [Candidatus Bathyarchaeia archaeon]